MDDLTKLPYDDTEDLTDENEFIMNEYFDPLAPSSVSFSAWAKIIIVMALVSLVCHHDMVYKLIRTVHPDSTSAHMNYITTGMTVLLAIGIFYIMSKNELV